MVKGYMERWVECQNHWREWAECNVLKQGCGEHIGNSDLRVDIKGEISSRVLNWPAAEYFQKLGQVLCFLSLWGTLKTRKTEY
jgi:hypothetical protein